MYVNCNLYNKNIYKESQIHALVKIKISEVFEEKYYCNIYLEYWLLVDSLSKFLMVSQWDVSVLILAM